MELSWSTFFLEIINFLILVWILTRFLYRPVMGVIGRRRAAIEQQVRAAESLREQAEALRARFEGRLAEWEGERRRAQAELREEIERERRRLMGELHESLRQEREKAQVIDARRREEERRRNEQAALALALRFVTRLLEGAAGPELDARLFDMALDGLRQLTPERLQALRAAWRVNPPERVIVTSAYPLSPERRRSLEELLTAHYGAGLPFDYREDPGLLAGVRVAIGPWLMHASLRDELQGFAEFAHEPASA